MVMTKIEFMENLCIELGSAYQVIEVDSEYIISGWFDNGHAVEIEINDNPADKFYATIHLYEDAEKIPEYEGEIMKEVGSIGNIHSVEDLELHLEALKARR